MPAAPANLESGPLTNLKAFCPRRVDADYPRIYSQLQHGIALGHTNVRERFPGQNEADGIAGPAEIKFENHGMRCKHGRHTGHENAHSHGCKPLQRKNRSQVTNRNTF